jgi:hypothetical protein
MEITEALRTFIAAQPAIAGLIGGAGALRWYPLTRPENAVYPCVTYQIISDPRTYTHDGDTGAIVARIQVTVWAKTYAALTQVSEALIGGLSGYRGLMGTVDVNGVFIPNAVDGYQPDTRLYNRNIDVLPQYYE